MKIEIRIGNIDSGIRKKYNHIKCDDVEKEKIHMYNFLSNSMDCIIEDVDNFLLYTLNTGLMAFIVKDTFIKDDDNQHITVLDPSIYRVFEIMEDGTEISIQDIKGNITKNYYNNLMGSIMDDFHDCLIYYK